MSRLSTKLATGLVVSIGALTTATVTPAYAAPDPAAATAAGEYLSAQVEDLADFAPGADPSFVRTPGSAADILIGLSAVGGFYTDVVRIGDFLQDQATAYATSAAAAGKLAIVAAVIGVDPTDFGGVDLIAVINGELDANGAYGYPDIFGQSLTIIGLVRSGATVAPSAITYLLDSQDPATGLFGYDDFNNPGTFVPDSDYSGVALQALIALSDAAPSAAIDTAIENVIAGLATLKTADASYPGYVPVNSTAIVGTSLLAAGEDAADSRTWLLGQQLADGGFPNPADETVSDLLATAQAILFLTDFSLLDAVFADEPPTTSVTSPPPAPTSTTVTAVLPTTTPDLDPQGAPVPPIAETGATTDGLVAGFAAVLVGLMILGFERTSRRTHVRKH